MRTRQMSEGKLDPADCFLLGYSGGSPRGGRQDCCVRARELPKGLPAEALGGRGLFWGRQSSIVVAPLELGRTAELMV